MSSELLSQLNALIADAERSAVEAELWRETRRLMLEAGYGPRITPVQIVSLVPNILGMNEILAATQEVVAAPAGSKMPRRKLTVADEHIIAQRTADGESAEQIARSLGLALKVVADYLERD